MFIFGTTQYLSVLWQCKVWLVDGTFDTAPLLFTQIYSIHGLRNGDTAPHHLLFALLPSKFEAMYLQLLCELKCLKQNLKPEVVLMDFKKAAMNASEVNHRFLDYNSFFIQ